MTADGAGGIDAPNPTPAALSARADHMRYLARWVANDEASLVLRDFAAELDAQARALQIQLDSAPLMMQADPPPE